MQIYIWSSRGGLGILGNTSGQKGSSDYRLAGRQGGSCAPPYHGLSYKSMKLYSEHSRVVLTENLNELGLPVGTVGTVIHVHQKPTGYEVEFSTREGETLAVASIHPYQIRAFAGSDLAHA